jgi:hypothetical protein
MRQDDFIILSIRAGNASPLHRKYLAAAFVKAWGRVDVVAVWDDLKYLYN